MNKPAILFLLLFALTLSACAGAEPIPSGEGLPEQTAMVSPLPDYSAAAPVFSEVMTRNHTTPLAGLLCDWVELKNDSSASLSLCGLFIGKKEDGSRKMPLPDYTLKAGEYCLLTEKELGFRLDKNGEDLFLFDEGGNILQSISVPALAGNESYTPEQGIVDTPSPGYPNNESRGASFAPGTLLISEACTCANKEWLPKDARRDDWVEIYNAGSAPVELSDYYLSDDQDEPFLLPLQGSLEAGKYCFISLHKDSAPFSLSSAGETLYLNNKDGLVCDLLDIPLVPAGCSYGKEAGEPLYYATPTPGRANYGGFASPCPEPCVSVPSGWYDESFTTKLSGEGELRYTTDGSLPTSQSKIYMGEEIPVNKSMSLRVRSFNQGQIPSNVVTVNYFLNEPSMTLDVVKISMSPVDVYTTLQKNATKRSEASIALYVNGEEHFSESCGISVLGSGGRTLRKLSMQIDFRSRYGKAELNYKLFDKINQTAFSTITLRSGSQDQLYASMRDELISDLFFDCSPHLLTFCYRPVNLYVNDTCWGIYYIRERCKSETVAYRYDVSKNSVDIIRNILLINHHDPASMDLQNLFKFIRTEDMSVQVNYEEVCKQLNIDSLIDYYISLMWSGNYDTNNIRFFRSQGDSGRWNLILYDSDVAFLVSNAGWVKKVFALHNQLFAELMENEEFCLRFTRRMGELFNGPLAEEKVIARIDALEAILDHDKVLDSALNYANPDYESWKQNVEALRNRVGYGIKGNNENIIRQYLDCVKLSPDVIKEVFGEEFCS